MLDWTDDVIELADALQLDRFSVMGLSGGGPYVAACAFKISHRVTAAAIISAVGPMDPSAIKEMPRNAIAYYNLGQGYINVGNLDEARRALENAAKINPKIKEIHFNLARVFQENGATGIDRSRLTAL